MILALMLMWNVSAKGSLTVAQPPAKMGVMDVHRAFMALDPSERWKFGDIMKNIGFAPGNLMTPAEYRQFRFQRSCSAAISVLRGAGLPERANIGSPKFTVSGEMNSATAELLVRAMTEKRSVHSLMDEEIQKQIDHGAIPSQGFLTMIEADVMLFGRDVLGNQGYGLNVRFSRVAELVNLGYTQVVGPQRLLGQHSPLFLRPLGDGGGRGRHTATVEVMQKDQAAK